MSSASAEPARHKKRNPRHTRTQTKSNASHARHHNSVSRDHSRKHYAPPMRQEVRARSHLFGGSDPHSEMSARRSVMYTNSHQLITQQRHQPCCITTITRANTPTQHHNVRDTSRNEASGQATTERHASHALHLTQHARVHNTLTLQHTRAPSTTRHHDTTGNTPHSARLSAHVSWRTTLRAAPHRRAQT